MAQDWFPKGLNPQVRVRSIQNVLLHFVQRASGRGIRSQVERIPASTSVQERETKENSQRCLREEQASGLSSHESAGTPRAHLLLRHRLHGVDTSCTKEQSVPRRMLEVAPL